MDGGNAGSEAGVSDIAVLPRPRASEYDDPTARALWAHEDDLIHQRIQWLCITQGLLFAAYAFSFQLPEAVLKESAAFRHFITILPGAGIWISLIVIGGLIAAVMSMWVIWWRSPWKRPGVTWLTTIGGMTCAVGVPTVFVFVWLKVLETTLVRFLSESLGSIAGLIR